jgi:hypothetical protein
MAQMGHIKVFLIVAMKIGAAERLPRSTGVQGVNPGDKILDAVRCIDFPGKYQGTG